MKRQLKIMVKQIDMLGFFFDVPCSREGQGGTIWTHYGTTTHLHGLE